MGETPAVALYLPLGGRRFAGGRVDGLQLKKILIVDDSLAEMRMIQAVLQDASFWPVAVNDPTKIEQAIETNTPA